MAVPSAFTVTTRCPGEVSPGMLKFMAELPEPSMVPVATNSVPTKTSAVPAVGKSAALTVTAAPRSTEGGFTVQLGKVGLRNVNGAEAVSTLPLGA